MKTLHLDSDGLLGYVHYTLDDATRESMDAHLATCPVCRTRLEQQQFLQRGITGELNSTLNRAGPSRQMSFASIAPQLKARSSWFFLWNRLSTFTPMALAFVGFGLALVGVLQMISLWNTPTPSLQMGSHSTFACFFLILVSVQQFDKALSIRPRFILMVILASILWLSSALIGVLNMLVIQDLAIWATISAGGRIIEATPAAMFALFFSAILYIAVVIGSAEYHFKHIGQPNSWKLFTITLLIQLLILILPYLIL